ncbi:MAG: lipid A deacylase LpxR family protein [Burkholderiales bacterium]
MASTSGFATLRRGIASAVLLSVLIAMSVASRAADGTLSLAIENDSISHTDRYYTHGIRIGWLGSENADRACGDRLMKVLPFIACATDARWQFDLTQVAFTPRDLSRTNPDPADRPYAGWLFGSVGVVARHNATLDQLNLSLGVVGPASQAEGSQRFIHDIQGLRGPQGWGRQLGSEFTVQTAYQRSVRIWRIESAAGYGLDVLPHYGAALGSVYAYANTGASVRFGKNLPDDFGPPRIQPGVPGSDYTKSNGKFGWYVFAGTDGRAVGRNLFLDGNSFRDGPSVERRVWVADLQAGLMIDWDPVRIGYTHVWRSREFRGQVTPQAFGALSIAYRF